VHQDVSKQFASRAHTERSQAASRALKQSAPAQASNKHTTLPPSAHTHSPPRYTPNGLVTIAIYFGGTYYLSLQDGSGEQPLLDSKFPNVAGKGRGYQIKAYSSGVDGWDSLRKVSVWQTQEAMQKEMEERMSKVSHTHARSKWRRCSQGASLFASLRLE